MMAAADVDCMMRDDEINAGTYVMFTRRYNTGATLQYALLTGMSYQ